MQSRANCPPPRFKQHLRQMRLNCLGYLTDVMRSSVRICSACVLALAICYSPLQAAEAVAESSASSTAQIKLSQPSELAAAAAQPASPVELYLGTATSIRELMMGALPLAINPASLFDIPLADDAAVALEAARLRALLKDAGASVSNSFNPAAATAPMGATAPTVTPANVDTALWAARLELDQVRFQFYSLSPEQRTSLLTAHAQRQAADAQQNAIAASEADQRARAAEAEQQRVLAQAQLAKSEAERLVGEERARLLGVASQLADAQAVLARAKGELTERAERTLALNRRVRQIISAPQANTAAVDALYLELRTWLRASRDELASDLTDTTVQPFVIRKGADPLANLPVQVDRSEVDALFASATATAKSLAEQSTEFQHNRLRQLYEEVQRLNEDRVALLPHLSPTRRDAITGFTLAGLDQALAEVRQVGLVLSYQLRTVTSWISSGEWRRSGKLAFNTSGVVLKLLFVIGVFFWGRRFGRNLLLEWQQRLRAEARRTRALDAGKLDGVIDITLQVFVPLSWLLLLLAIVWVLPAAVMQQMEVTLLVTVMRWSLGGWLAIMTLDKLAMRRTTRMSQRHLISTDDIRLRSLRLLGVTVVVIGLILSLSQRIVGNGTIYSWVLSTCWWAAIPIGLIIVKWWRGAIFERIGFVARKSTFEAWVLSQQSGWTSLLAALLAGGYLFAKGTLALLKSWLIDFEFTRRLLAYLFRQKLDRMAEQRGALSLVPLSPAVTTSLSPRTESAEMIEYDDDSSVAKLLTLIDQPGGGVFAVVGERGSGRSTALNRICELRTNVTVINCGFDGLAALTATLAQAMQLPTDCHLQTLAAKLDERQDDSAIVIDNAHRLIHPVMGGLQAFDQLMQVVRQHNAHCAWVFAMDQIVWRFYGRSRTANLLFDSVMLLEPWSEAGIAELLQNRSRQAGITPAFDSLVPELQAQTDEFVRNEALQNAARSYYRLVWDYSDGNPGVALHMWRTSLGMGNDGRVFVTPFRAPDSTIFDRLPDSAVFVMRAVLQMENALAEDIAKATRVALVEVDNALRYGLKSGYLELTAGRYAIVWHWYRPLTRFMQRRHLLAND
ncbi:MAG: cell envelope integrity protein TolA [Steroidobacteraceae bacterium]